MVLEFLRAFGEVFDLKDEFPDGVSLGQSLVSSSLILPSFWFCLCSNRGCLSPFISTEVLEEALVGSDPEGPLCELLFFFLSAIFQALDEEQEEVTKDQAEGWKHTLCVHFNCTHWSALVLDVAQYSVDQCLCINKLHKFYHV